MPPRTSSAHLNEIVSEARQWAKLANIALIEASIPKDPKAVEIVWSEPASRYMEFFEFSQKLGAPYLVCEFDQLQEEDIEEAIASATQLSAHPQVFSELWACRSEVGQASLLRFSFIDPKTSALFHLELFAPWYELIFFTQELLSERANQDDVNDDTPKVLS